MFDKYISWQSYLQLQINIKTQIIFLIKNKYSV